MNSIRKCCLKILKAKTTAEKSTDSDENSSWIDVKRSMRTISDTCLKQFLESDQDMEVHIDVCILQNMGDTCLTKKMLRYGINQEKSILFPLVG